MFVLVCVYLAPTRRTSREYRCCQSWRPGWWRGCTPHTPCRSQGTDQSGGRPGSRHASRHTAQPCHHQTCRFSEDFQQQTAGGREGGVKEERKERKTIKCQTSLLSSMATKQKVSLAGWIYSHVNVLDVLRADIPGQWHHTVLTEADGAAVVDWNTAAVNQSVKLRSLTLSQHTQTNVFL